MKLPFEPFCKAMKEWEEHDKRKLEFARFWNPATWEETPFAEAIKFHVKQRGAGE